MGSGEEDVKGRGGVDDRGCTDLTRPKGYQRAKGIACLDLGPPHLLDRCAKGDWESAGWTSLYFDLCHLERAQGDISKDFGRR